MSDQAWALLFKVPLDIKFYAPIIGTFFLRSKVTGREFPPLPVVLNTLAAQAMSRTIGVCAGACL
jgi:hypothetical protein